MLILLWSIMQLLSLTDLNLFHLVWNFFVTSQLFQFCAEGEPSLKVYFCVVSVRKNESKIETLQKRMQYFEIWIHFYALTWYQKYAFKLCSSLTLIGISYESKKKCLSLAPPRDIFYKILKKEIKIPNQKRQ